MKRHFDNIIQRSIEADRRTKQLATVTLDVCLLIFAVWLAYSVRLGVFFEPNTEQLALTLTAPLIAVPIFTRLGLYRSVIRYVGEQALWSVVKGMSLAALGWASIAFMTQMNGLEGVPRTVPVLYWLFGVTAIGGSRFAARWLLWLPVRKRFKGRQVLIYGAGDAGRQLATALSNGHELFPAGFLDDKKALQGKDIDSRRVYAPSQLPDLIDRFGIRDVIVTMPSASSAERRRVVEFLEPFPVQVRILPAVSAIADGRHLVNLVREVDIGDLLGRDPVAADPSLLGRCVTGKSVLITGAGGSIGAELCRQIIALEPARLVLLETNEYALYEIDRLLHAITSCDIVSKLGSVNDESLVENLLLEHRIETIYHAAAHKHVPLVEENVLEGARNNVLGTRVLADAAFRTGVETFVLISTDKAVRPTNIMGATKRWAELIVQDFARKAVAKGTGQRFSAVRFGNVLGSSGSVIPLFNEQIARGGPVTVTHKDVSRFFMSIHEAVELVIQAGSLAEGGEIFLLDMGDPVKIVDLARNMIRLAGHEVRDENNLQGEIEITIVGLRPAEKLHEELLITDSNAEGTRHPKIMKATEPGLDTSTPLPELLGHLQNCIDNQDELAARVLLMNEITLSNTSVAETEKNSKVVKLHPSG